MASRNLDHGFNFAKGLVYLDFSFATNNTSNPLTSSFRGGVDGVQSVTYSAVGILIFTIKDRFRYVVSKTVELDDLNSSDDGAYASSGAVQNEGTATQMNFKLYTRAAAGTKTDYTGRRVNVSLVLKDSTVGV